MPVANWNSATAHEEGQLKAFQGMGQLRQAATRRGGG